MRTLALFLIAVASCGPEASAPPTTVDVPAPTLAIETARPSATSEASPSAKRSLPPLAGEPEEVRHAREHHLRVALVFHAEWSEESKELARNTLTSSDVQKRLQRFVLVRVDATQEDDPAVAVILERYGVRGLPAILLFDRAHIRRKEITSFVDNDDLSAALDSVP